MKEGTIPPNYIDLVQSISQSGAPNNIDLKDTWFNPDVEEYTRQTPIYEPSAPLDNISNTLKISQSLSQLQEGTAIREGLSLN